MPAAGRCLLAWLESRVCHATDSRNGNLQKLGQHWRSETVAELGGAVLLRVLGYDHDANLGGCWDYIQWYAKKEGLEVFDARGKVLTRTCDAVALILDTAEELTSQGIGDAACVWPVIETESLLRQHGSPNSTTPSVGQGVDELLVLADRTHNLV